MRSELAGSGWVEVARGVFVHTSRRELTTSTLVVADSGAPRQALLVDPAWEPDELAALADSIAAAGITIAAGFATHAHHDHLLWHPGFGSGPRWASPDTALLSQRHRAALAAELGSDFPGHLVALMGRVRPVTKLPWAGREIRLIRHHAHEIGHCALYVVDAHTLVAGDMLSDVELPIAARKPVGHDPAEPLEAYLEGLEALSAVAARARMLVPGHGHPGHHPAHRVAADKRYWRGLLAGGDTVDPRLRQPGMPQVDAENRELAAHYLARARRRHQLGVE